MKRGDGRWQSVGIAPRPLFWLALAPFCQRDTSLSEGLPSSCVANDLLNLLPLRMPLDETRWPPGGIQNREHDGNPKHGQESPNHVEQPSSPHFLGDFLGIQGAEHPKDKRQCYECGTQQHHAEENNHAWLVKPRARANVALRTRLNVRRVEAGRGRVVRERMERLEQGRGLLFVGLEDGPVFRREELQLREVGVGNRLPSLGGGH